ncbi:MAG: hypothetical protein SOZ27_01425 [Spirochaetia bacterium]|nr:hypothetical protein [Spirochaetia bacterium]
MKKLLIFLAVFSMIGCTADYVKSEGTLSKDTVVVESSEVVAFDASAGELKLANDYSGAKYIIVKNGENMPGGRLLAVDSVSNGVYRVKDTQLANAVKDLKFKSTYQLKESDIVSAKPLARGVTLDPENPFVIDLGTKRIADFVEDSESAYDAGLDLNGKLYIDPYLNFDIDITNFELQKFVIELEASLKAEMNIALSASVSYSSYVPLFEYNYNVITVMAGPVPIIFQPIIEVGLDANFNASVRATLIISETIAFGAGAVYENENWTTKKYFDAGLPEVEPISVNAKANAGVGVNEKVGIMLYGVLGANLQAREFLSADYTGNAEIDLTAGAVTSDQNLTLKFGMGVGVNIRISAFSIIDKEFQVWGQNWTFAQMDWNCRLDSDPVWTGLIPEAINK